MRCGLREAVRIFCGQIGASSVRGELGSVLGMTDKIVFKTIRYQIALSNTIDDLTIDD